MAIDQMDWHYGAADFPTNVPQENAGVHIGFFLAWAFERGMAGEIHTEEEPQAIEQLVKREITGVDFLVQYCDEKLWGEDFNQQGEAFALDYYENADSEFAQSFGNYLSDYNQVFAEYDDYAVPNDWVHFERIKPILDERFAQWQNLVQAA
ncbi:DUF7832 domain-containing protein [Alysiella filiformis]|uniref:DUF7832 domain-containing protein n=1 Tax=Alysiella filiformis DSM 16848 TaxID=1120981 RepID=A0A286E1E6_9NEIS|nr:hypothetical protein [Alysiella filiformis]QMT30729.1 hypothetical protein H3L97_08255 [Alysiella filiformis]UBQ56291.1 hypothetical protein JF568_00430 [Alysiella filiformis DSM 16848]SOD64724.1 hypothetical protein SAMN02746062_00003 [Alysiella filiformis DSM 16848]